MSALAVFSFPEEHQVRVVMINGEPWFVASDVCMASGIDSTAIRNFDEDEKGQAR
ncbi:TPA: BRO-N domain-containing protein [Escherichia coli]